MTDATMTPVAPFGAITTLRVVNSFTNVIDSVRRWNETRRTIAILRSLSATQLDDIGLTRADIEDFGSEVR